MSIRQLGVHSVWVHNETREEVVIDEAVEKLDGTLIINEDQEYSSVEEFTETHHRVQ